MVVLQIDAPFASRRNRVVLCKTLSTSDQSVPQTCLQPDCYWWLSIEGEEYHFDVRIHKSRARIKLGIRERNDDNQIKLLQLRKSLG